MCTKNIFCCLLFCFLIVISACFGREKTPFKQPNSFCTNDTSYGDPNLNPIDDSPPRLVNKVENGTLYLVGTGEDQSWLIHVWGTSGYDFGFAYGTLLREQINQLIPRAWAHFEAQIMEELANLKLPEWFKEIIADQGLAFALDFENDLVQTYIDEEIYEEMRGIADASKADYHTIRRIHMLIEITRGHCSLYSLWGDAALGGKTLKLRALDWDTDSGAQDFPVITVYHPLSSKLGHAFANVAWAGYIGTLTGTSSTRVGISSIGVSYPDDTFGDETFIGLPFIFVQRYIIQYAETLDDALSYIANVKRTCHLILGLADGKLATGRMVQYSHSKVNFFDDKNLQPLADWHPRIPNTVYCGMDWNCPAFQYRLYTQLHAYYGQITPELSIRNITSYVQSGDVQVVVFDLTDNFMYVANARGTNEHGPLPAYQRQFFKVDLNIEFARTQ